MSRRALLLALGTIVSGCLPDWGDPGSLTCTYEGCDDTDTTGAPDMPGTTESPDTSGATPTTGAEDPPGTATTDPDDDATTSTGTSEPGEPPPEIVDVEVIPMSIGENGYIAVHAYTLGAETVEMQIHNGDTIALDPVDTDRFTGYIPAFTALHNGNHQAVMVPRRGELVGAVTKADYTIDLPPAGSEGLWQTGDPLGVGQIVAIRVRRSDQRIVLLGTRYENNQPHCVLYLRSRNGAYDEEADVFEPLPGKHCSAVDLAIDPDTDELYVLAYREQDFVQRWWLGKSEWGMAPLTLGDGAEGDTVYALAEHDGTVAACGGSEAQTGDRDATTWLFSEDLPVDKRLFDRAPTDGNAHKLDETAFGCTFADDRLVLVGGSFGDHMDPDKVPRDRRFILQHDIDLHTETWTVGGPGPGTQSRAVDVATDDKGHIFVAGYTCGDVCSNPDGELRIHDADGNFVDQIPLGSFGPLFAGPNAIAWSPAGYILVVMADESGPSPRYKVQAFSLTSDEPLWTYLPTDAAGLQVALAVAVGPHGEVYTGGIAAGIYLAIAFLFG